MLGEAREGLAELLVVQGDVMPTPRALVLFAGAGFFGGLFRLFDLPTAAGSLHGPVEVGLLHFGLILKLSNGFSDFILGFEFG